MGSLGLFEDLQMADNKERTEAVIKACYSTWAESYHEDYYASSKAYPPVHLDLIRALLRDANARTLIDAGCGPASMLRGLTDLGLRSFWFRPDTRNDCGCPAGNGAAGLAREPFVGGQRNEFV